MHNLESRLRNNGLKVTPQRMAILEHIQNRGHATIEEVYEDILKAYPSISLATIYKNIISLCEIDVLREIKVSMQKCRYEVHYEEHAHLVCSECGMLEDVAIPTETLFAIPNVSKVLIPQSAAITIYGRCRVCNEKNKRI